MTRSKAQTITQAYLHIPSLETIVTQHVVMILHMPLGNGVGDECEGDMDGDGTSDEVDVCPMNAKIQQTDFSRGFLRVSLDPSGRNKPFWMINDNVSIADWQLVD